ncbi:MAG: hypothetical protein HZB83_03720, partial [Deltaproteobacteria bacterium]|nr:hypothetical protein [Deltaproteobacteria bacterium]
MKDMTQIIEWLLKMETAAAILYDKAAAHFSSDREFAEFIRQLGREEQQHLEMMQRAAQVVKGMGEIAPAITIDRVVEESIEEGNFASCKKRLEERSLTKDEMMECVVATEFSEWNDIFLYVINVMKRGFREFIPAVARMQQHKKSIERFLETRPEFNAHLEKVRELADIWQEKILIVDDE